MERIFAALILGLLISAAADEIADSISAEKPRCDVSGPNHETKMQSAEGSRQ